MSNQPHPTDILQNSSNPETLDRVISTTTPRLWLAFVGIVIALIAIVGWAFLSSIPVSVQNYGVVSIPGEYTVVPASVDGSVTFADVEVDDKVTAGQRIATLTPFDGSSSQEITAPIDGVLSLIDIPNGSGVRAGQTIAAVTGISSDRRVNVIAYVDSVALPTYTQGQTVEIRLAVDSETAPTVTGVVRSVTRVPTNGIELLNSIPGVAIAELSDLTDGLLYPLVISLDDGDETASVEVGQIVTIINTYRTIRPIDAIFPGME